MLARQTRMRKKFFYQSLQKRMSTLRMENKALKTIVTEKLGDRAQQIVDECSSELSREVMASSGHIGDEDSEIALAECYPDSTMHGGVGAAAAGGGEGAGGTGAGSRSNISKRDLAKSDFRLMQSLQLVSELVSSAHRVIR